MAFQFNKDNAFARVAVSSKKESIVDLESALNYVQEKVAEFEKNDWKDCPWIKEDKDTKAVVVEANLFNMPLYWSYDKTGKKRTIRNPDMTVLRTEDEMIGSPMYSVANEDEAKDMLKALASGTNKDLNEILERAALALVNVLTVENKAITERAKTVYNGRNHVAKYGAFAEADETSPAGRMRISSEKQNKMNSAKQQARADLGYKRAKVSPK